MKTFEEVKEESGKLLDECEKKLNDLRELKEKHQKYADIIARAIEIRLMTEQDALSTMMDIESADKKFNLRLDEWLKADNFNFAHDFYGIRDCIDRGNGFPATDFGLFIPRFAGVWEE